MLPESQASHVHCCLTLQEQKRDKFDQVVIETTGLADPEPLIQTFTTIPVSTYPSSCYALPFRASQAATCMFHTCECACCKQKLSCMQSNLRTQWTSPPGSCAEHCKSQRRANVAGFFFVLTSADWFQAVAAHYALDGVLTLVDAKHIGQHLDEKKPDGVVNEAISQVAYADRIILNKTDLVCRLPVSKFSRLPAGKVFL